MAVAAGAAGGLAIRRLLLRRRLLRWQSLPAVGGAVETGVVAVVGAAAAPAAAAAVAAVAGGCGVATERLRLRRQLPKPVDGLALDSYLGPEWLHRHRPASLCTDASAIGLVGRSLP